MARVRLPWLLPLVLLGAGLPAAVSHVLAVQGQKEGSPGMNTAEPTRLEQWRHPVTGERVTLTFGDGMTRLERGGRVSEQGKPPFDEAAELQKAQEEVGRWDVSGLRHLREMAGAGVFRDQGILGPEDLGFPPRLWEELDTLYAEMERRGAGTLSRNDPPGSLLWNPTPEMRRRFAELTASRVRVTPPPADTAFRRQSRHLGNGGLVRLIARRPDGSLWLPPALEPHRASLQASERPVVRLAAEPGRTPHPWESKVGGVPYRPRGEVWPTAPDGRPLVFLAQINLAEVGGDGRALPDFPRRGLLQFFILNDLFYGADVGGRSERTVQAPPERFRVLYWPEVPSDAAGLDRSVPPPQPDPDDPSLSPDETLPHDPAREVALAFLAEREPVSGADDTSGPRLLDLHGRGDQGAQAVRSALYDLSPGGHKLGGYADFTQPDPRRPEDDLILLFQLDSDERLGLMWGDAGTANFFIRPADLKARDFSKVAYHWDCG